MKKTILILTTLFLLGGLTGCASCTPDSKMDKAKVSYDNAVEKCGVENIEEHNYTNGSKDYDCKDYSKAKK